jgi:hypothetical protein
MQKYITAKTDAQNHSDLFSVLLLINYTDLIYGGFGYLKVLDGFNSMF